MWPFKSEPKMNFYRNTLTNEVFAWKHSVKANHIEGLTKVEFEKQSELIETGEITVAKSYCLVSSSDGNFDVLFIKPAVRNLGIVELHLVSGETRNCNVHGLSIYVDDEGVISHSTLTDKPVRNIVGNPHFRDYVLPKQYKNPTINLI